LKEARRQDSEEEEQRQQQLAEQKELDGERLTAEQLEQAEASDHAWWSNSWESAQSTSLGEDNWGGNSAQSTSQTADADGAIAWSTGGRWTEVDWGGNDAQSTDQTADHGGATWDNHRHQWHWEENQWLQPNEQQWTGNNTWTDDTGNNTWTDDTGNNTWTDDTGNTPWTDDSWGAYDRADMDRPWVHRVARCLIELMSQKCKEIDFLEMGLSGVEIVAKAKRRLLRTTRPSKLRYNVKSRWSPR
jgi:hypothetical protein